MIHTTIVRLREVYDRILFEYVVEDRVKRQSMALDSWQFPATGQNCFHDSALFCAFILLLIFQTGTWSARGHTQSVIKLSLRDKHDNTSLFA